MSVPSNEQVINRYLDAPLRHDNEEIGRLRAPGWFSEWPQSKERVRGHANDMQIMANWPGGSPEAEGIRIAGAEDRWVLTPSMTYQRVAGSGDMWWAEGIGHYPDGSSWHSIGLFEVRDGAVQRETWYFGPELEAPAWRAAWVERITPEESSNRR